MTQEFAEITNLLARARNIEGGTHLLITATPDEEEITISMKGDDTIIVCSVCDVLKKILEVTSDDTKARAFRELLKQVIVADEQRRFQED